MKILALSLKSDKTTFRPSALGVLISLLPLSVSPAFSQQSVSIPSTLPPVDSWVVERCSRVAGPERPNWSSLEWCWSAVMLSLGDHRSQPAQIIALQQKWESVWTPAVQALFPNRPVSVNETLAQKLQQEFDPVKFALDKVIDAVVKKYAPKIVVWAWAVSSGTVATFVTTFLDPNTIATDYQEMCYFDVSLNRKVFFFLEPYMERDWRKKVTEALTRAAGPVMMTPPQGSL